MPGIVLLTGPEFIKDFAFKLIGFFVGLAAGLATYAIIVEPLYQLFN